MSPDDPESKEPEKRPPDPLMGEPTSEEPENPQWKPLPDLPPPPPRKPDPLMGEPIEEETEPPAQEASVPPAPEPPPQRPPDPLLGESAEDASPPPPVLPQPVASDTSEPEPAKRKIFSNPVVILLIVLLLAGAGAAFYYLVLPFFQTKPLPSQAANATADTGDFKTFKLKDGRVVFGRVAYEDDVYYTVDTLKGQEIVIKSDLAE